MRKVELEWLVTDWLLVRFEYITFRGSEEDKRRIQLQIHQVVVCVYEGVVCVGQRKLEQTGWS